MQNDVDVDVITMNIEQVLIDNIMLELCTAHQTRHDVRLVHARDVTAAECSRCWRQHAVGANDAHVTRVEDVFENGVDLVLFRRDVLHINRVGGVESARGEMRCEVDVTNAATAEATRHASQLANTTLDFGVELD